MIVSVCGFGDTGASAVTDYLLECTDACIFDYMEFTLAYMPDGLEDLEYHLMHKISRQSSSVYAIQRFHRAIMNRSREWHNRTGISCSTIEKLTKDFIDSITQLSYVGFSPMIDKPHCEFARHYIGESIILHRVVPFLERHKIIRKDYDFYPLDEVRVSVKPDNFYIKAREYVRNLLTAMGCDFSKTVVLDQAFVANDPVKSFQFFDNPKAIIIDRDPRDMYISGKKYALSVCRFYPKDTVENFIRYYKLMRDNQPYKDNREDVLRINFEEMIYDYDNTTKKIEAFVGVKNASPKSIFVPERSAANTKLWEKYSEFDEDIDLIQKELSEYIFDYDKYGKVEVVGDSFTHKSPLNKHYNGEYGY